LWKQETVCICRDRQAGKEGEKRKQITQDPTRQLVNFFSGPFERAIDRLRQGASMQQACTTLLEHPAVSRCYLVDDRGVQIADTLVSDFTIRNQDPRFRPLENTASADWFRQQYLRQALDQPDNLHVTTPYLCVTGAYMCVTLSLAYNHQGTLKVLCCDILANATQTP